MILWKGINSNNNQNIYLYMLNQITDIHIHSHPFTINMFLS